MSKKSENKKSSKKKKKLSKQDSDSTSTIFDTVNSTLFSHDNNSSSSVSLLPKVRNLRKKNLIVNDTFPSSPIDLATVPSGQHSYIPGNIAAFFDVDNTLVQGASLVHYARGLARRNYFGYTELLGFVWHQMKFRLVGKENIHDVDYGKEQALAFIAGRKTSEFVHLGEELYEECIGNKLWSATCQIAKDHIAQGRQVWLITATPQQLASMIAYKLGLTGARGTIAEAKNGVFTGRLVGKIMHGQAKADALLQIAADNAIDLANSYAYSDSINDLPMLQSVGNPIAINPDAQLREFAKTHNWEIYDLRATRKAAKFGVPALLLGAASGSAAAAVKLARR